MHFFEKLKIIPSAKEMMILNEIRNRVVHDYIEEDFTELHLEIYKISPILFLIEKSVIKFIKKEKEKK